MESISGKMGVKTPDLTKEQAHQWQTRWATALVKFPCVRYFNYFDLKIIKDYSMLGQHHELGPVTRILTC